MTKKIKDGKPHSACTHAIPCSSHMSNDGKPLLGRCHHREHAFLLSELTDCSHFDCANTTQ